MMPNDNAPPSWASNPPPQQSQAAASQPEAPPSWADTSSPAPLSADQHESALFATYSTLDEPVSETIMRDVRAVIAKFKVILKPLDRKIPVSPYTLVAAGEETADEDEPELSENDRQIIQSLKDWDLWGPLILCLSLAIILSFKAPVGQASLVFASVFSTVWVGGVVVTMNAQLLGGTISFFQSLCVLGYSTFPLTIAALVIGLLRILVHTWWWIDLIFIVVGFAWSIRVSSVFIALYIRPERRFLALYPVFFYYTFLSWMILLF